MMKTMMQWTCVLSLAASSLTAQNATPVVRLHHRSSGMVGIAGGQTARLNLLSPDLPAPLATGVMCSASVSFINAQGTVLKSGTLTVIPGQSVHIDLDSVADLKYAVNERHEIRATIQVPVAPPPSGSATANVPVCRLIPTLEMFDTLTGRTSVIVGHTHFAAERPEPTPAASPTATSN
jgi:hypothetical protein